jgi:hypothetical protein
MIGVLLLCFQLTGHFLLMQPIEEAIQKGSFQAFLPILSRRISLHLDKPFDLYGYVEAPTFTTEFERAFFSYKTEHIDWISKQIDGDFAVQTLNIILWNAAARQRVYYKLVFFLRREGGQWRLYHLRGLAM